MFHSFKLTHLEWICSVSEMATAAAATTASNNNNNNNNNNKNSNDNVNEYILNFISDM